MKKIIGIFSICMMLLILSFYPIIASDPNDDDIIYWTDPSEEVVVEPYTLPFFEVYDLKDFGQAVFGLTSADFNGDGWLDFAVGWTTSPNNYSGISIFYRDGDRSFRVEEIKRYQWGINDLESEDLDDDGDIDLMCVIESGYGVETVNILFNDNGCFDQELKIADFYREDGNWINVHIAIADFDGDDDIDFIAGGNCGKVNFFKNDGTNRFVDMGTIYDYGDVSWGLDSADFNNDGYPDFIVSASDNIDSDEFGEGRIYLKLNDQTSTCFDTSSGILIKEINRNVDIIGSCEHGSLSIIDYDNDHDLDFLAGYYNPFLYNNHDEMFDRFPLCNLQESENSWDSLRQGGFATGDFNNDGNMDFIAGGVQGTVRLFINKYQEFPPIKPRITPPGIEISAGMDNEYMFTISDINEDDVFLYVDWGDGTETDWLGPFKSGEIVKLNHTWIDRGSYAIEAKAKDVHGNEGSWSTMKGWVSKQKIQMNVAVLSQIYLELDKESSMVQEIMDNYHSDPSGILTNIDITIKNPNSNLNNDVMIAPFFSTFFSQVTGIGSLEAVLPQTTVTIHIPVFWGRITDYPIDDEDVFIVDGWVPFVKWTYLN
ncbi:MAG: VCBS repeat-containing protein [Thermoplasmatota archaeon]